MLPLPTEHQAGPTNHHQTPHQMYSAEAKSAVDQAAPIPQPSRAPRSASSSPRHRQPPQPRLRQRKPGASSPPATNTIKSRPATRASCSPRGTASRRRTCTRGILSWVWPGRIARRSCGWAIITALAWWARRPVLGSRSRPPLPLSGPRRQRRRRRRRRHLLLVRLQLLLRCLRLRSRVVSLPLAINMPKPCRAHTAHYSPVTTALPRLSCMLGTQCWVRTGRIVARLSLLGTTIALEFQVDRLEMMSSYVLDMHFREAIN